MQNQTLSRFNVNTNQPAPQCLPRLQVLDKAARQRLVDNIADSLSGAVDHVQQRCVEQFGRVHADFGGAVQAALRARRQRAHL